MNAVQKIKARHEAREWADIEGIWRSIKPALEANVERRREVEAAEPGSPRSSRQWKMPARSWSTWPCAAPDFRSRCCDGAGISPLPPLWGAVERELHLPR